MNKNAIQGSFYLTPTLRRSSNLIENSDNFKISGGKLSSLKLNCIFCGTGNEELGCA
jgi:hypothetical protein